jgi:glycosyltransferase involved in cell wall biosynthesis
MTPLFSIIIPTHNRPNLLRRAINSIKSNSIKEIEIIVISDCKDSETSIVADEILGNHDIYIRRNGCLGPAESRNIGISLAKGMNIIFLDDDDAFEENYLDNISQILNLNNKLIIYSNFEIIEENRTISLTNNQKNTTSLAQKFSVKDINKKSVYIKNFIHNHTTVFPSAILKNKLQDTNLSSLEDWDFLLNAHQNADLFHADIFGPIIYKDPNLIGENRGTTPKALNSTVILDYLQIYKKYPCLDDETIKLERKLLLKSAGFTPYDDWF